MKAKPTIVEFVTNENLLGLSISDCQKTLLKAIYSLPLTDAELEMFVQCTGRETYAAAGYSEVTVLSGARAGKDSRIAAPIVCYEALFGGHEHHLGKGERGVIPLVAQDARAARIAFGYIKDYLLHSKLLAPQVAEPLANEIELVNGLRIVCFPCTQTSLRGWSIPVAVMDEIGFFRLEGAADSDTEIQASIRRGMIGFPSTRLIKISTPYMKSGVLYDDYRNHFGQDSPDILVWKASTVLMNPTIKAARLEREKRLDSERYGREYEAEFAEDLESFLPTALVESAVISGRLELPALEGVKYTASCDATGGGTGRNPDFFTHSIVHVEGSGADRRIVQDVCRGWRSARGQHVDLEGIVAQIATNCRNYRVKEIHGDKYSAAWVRQAFERQGIKYLECPDKSTCYMEMQPLFLQGNIAILDHPQLQRELRTLESRPRAGGRTIVDHARGSHDDHANSLAVAVQVVAATKKSLPVTWGRDKTETEGQLAKEVWERVNGRWICRQGLLPKTFIDGETKYSHRHGPVECFDHSCVRPIW
jgi:hypothetical protein